MQSNKLNYWGLDDFAVFHLLNQAMLRSLIATPEASDAAAQVMLKFVVCLSLLYGSRFNITH